MYTLSNATGQSPMPNGCRRRCASLCHQVYLSSEELIAPVWKHGTSTWRPKTCTDVVPQLRNCGCRATDVSNSSISLRASLLPRPL